MNIYGNRKGKENTKSKDEKYGKGNEKYVSLKKVYEKINYITSNYE